MTGKTSSLSADALPRWREAQTDDGVQMSFWSGNTASAVLGIGLGAPLCLRGLVAAIAYTREEGMPGSLASKDIGDVLAGRVRAALAARRGAA